MNNLSYILLASTLVLSIAVWHCYSTSKPLKKAAQEKREVEARAKSRQEEAGRERNRQEVFRKETLNVIQSTLRDPHHLHGLGLDDLRRFVEKVNYNKEHEADLKFWKDRVSKQSELIRDLQLNQREILKALQMGHPVEL